MPPRDPFNAEIQSNGWTQYQKLVLAELERHEKQLENVKKDIVEVKLAQNSIISDINTLQKSISDLSALLKENAANQLEADNKAVEQRLDIRELKLKIGFLCGIIGLVSGISGSSIFSALSKMFSH